MTISTLAFKIASIRLDGGTQTRAGKDPGTVQDYRAALLDGATFPPVVIFQDGPNNWLADGFHRVEAATLAGLVEIAADVRQGTARDARLFGLGANKTHGLRLTNADKRAAVAGILDDTEWASWSDHAIARQVGVSQPFVSKMRAERAMSVIGPSWLPEPGVMASGIVVGEFADFAVIVPSSHGEPWIWVETIMSGQDAVFFPKREVHRDHVAHWLKVMGFQADEARWTYEPVSDEPDDDDGGADFGKRWSWPHFGFESKREWLEYSRWWAYPKDGPVYQAGRAREQAEGESILARCPPGPSDDPSTPDDDPGDEQARSSTPATAPLAVLVEEATRTDREGPLPSWIKTGKPGAGR